MKVHLNSEIRNEILLQIINCLLIQNKFVAYPKLVLCDELHRRLIRCFLGVGKKCPIPSMEGDMGWLPPYVRHKVETVRLWCHLCLLSPDRLTRRVFDWDYRQAQIGKSTWAKNAGAILQDCDLEALKNTRLLTSSKKWVVDTAISKLTNIFELQWKAEINNMPKLRTYK